MKPKPKDLELFAEPEPKNTAKEAPATPPRMAAGKPKPKGGGKSPGTAVATRQQAAPAKARPIAAEPPALNSPMGTVLAMAQMLERLAANPDVDADKFDRLLAAQERMLDRASRDAFDRAMIEMQPELPIITKDGRIVVHAKDDRTGKRTGEKTQDTPYARWDKMVPVLKPILSKHGFSLTHRSSTAPDGRLRVTAILKGHGFTDDTCYLDLQADATGSKNNAQGWASSLSYGKRHTACAVLNIVTKDEDDDGRASGRPMVVGQPVTAEQHERLIELAAAVRCSEPRIVARMNHLKPKSHPDMKTLAELPQSRFDEAVKELQLLEPFVAKEGESAK